MRPRDIVILLVVVAAANGLAQELDEEGLDLGINLDEMSGKERATAVLRLCQAKEPDIELLYDVFASGRDSAAVKKKVFDVLAAHASPRWFKRARSLVDSPDPSVRICGIRLIGLSRHPSAAATLIGIEKPPYRCDRAEIINALGFRGDKRAIPYLRRAGQEDKALYELAVLARIRLGDSSALPQFFAIYGKTSDELAHLYVYLPWARKSKTARKVARVEQQIAEHRQRVKEMKDLLLGVPRSFIPEIVAYLRRSSEPHAVTLIFDNLGRIITRDNARDFLPLMYHRSTVLAQAVLERVYDVGTDETRKALQTAISRMLKSADPHQRRLAINNWQYLPHTKRAEAIRAGLADNSRMVRIEAAKSAARLGNSAFCPILEAALRETSDETMRFWCRAALYELKHPLKNRDQDR